MDRINEWRNLIKQAITEAAQPMENPESCDIETVCVFDETRDHYFLMRIGWEGVKHVQYTTLHVRIKNGKIWIEEDWTEEGITAEFLRAGVRNEDIVLGFQHPSMRQYTDFAVA